MMKAIAATPPPLPLGDALLRHAHRLQQYGGLPEPGRDLDQVLRVVDVALGQEAVQRADPSLVVAVLRREVLQPDGVVRAAAGAADGGYDPVPRRHLHASYSPGLLTSLGLFLSLWAVLTRQVVRERLLTRRQTVAAIAVAGPLHAVVVAQQVFGVGRR